jgi:hypothetical protein
MRSLLAVALTLLAIVPLQAATTSAKRVKALERVRYVEYAGKQQDWPTSTQPMVEIQHTKYGVPIYYGLPNKAYEIIGTLRAAGGNTIKHAAEAAQAAGADALLVAGDRAFSDAGIDIKPDTSSRGSSQGKIKLFEAILIRWKRL